MARRRQVVDDGATDDPSRVDNIPSQAGDDAGSIVGFRDDEEEVIEDVNAPSKREDARSDAEIAEERRVATEKDAIRERANEGTDGDADRTTRRKPRGRDDRDGDDDDSEMSRKMRRRVARERALREESDQQVTNLTAEKRALEQRLARAESGGDAKAIETSISGLKAKISSLTTELEKAIEGGDTKAQLAATIALGEAQSELKLAERDLKAAKTQAEKEAADAGPGTVTPQKTQRPKIVDDWLAANKRWWNLPSYAELQKASVEIDRLIRDEIRNGELDMGEYSEEHVDEMTRRLAEEAERLGMDVEIKDFEGEPWAADEDDDDQRDSRRSDTARPGREGKDVKNDRGGRNNRGPQGGMGGREGRRGAQSDLELARQGKARLTEDDYSTMRIFKLDANDPEVRKRFAKERVRTILTNARNTGGRR